jgi:hypothetical protein
MKKLLAIATVAALSAFSAFGQGQIVFGNTTAGAGFKLTVTNASLGVVQTVGTGSPLLGTGSVRITLLVGNTGDPISSMVPVPSAIAPLGATVLTNALTTTALSQGTFSGGTATFSIGWDTVSKPTIQYAYVGWDIASGITSWTSLFTGNVFTPESSGVNFAAFSGIIAGYQPGFGTASAGNTFGSAAFQIPTLRFNPYVAVPEPSSFVLAGLGAAALMIFRRRK